MPPPRLGQRSHDLRDLARKEVAKIFGVTPKMIETLEKQGRIEGKRVNGEAFYSAEAVDRLVREYRPDPKAKRRSSITTRKAGISGHLAAQVFQLFKSGVNDLAEVSIQTKASPDVIRTLWGEWKERLLAP